VRGHCISNFAYPHLARINHLLRTGQLAVAWSRKEGLAGGCVVPVGQHGI
jgi:hypothetical protein